MVVLATTLITLMEWTKIADWMEPFICLGNFSLWTSYAISVDSVILNNRVLKFIAEISLEIYLCHMFVYRIIEKLHCIYILGQGYGAYIFTVFLTFVGSVVVSLLLKKILEYIQHILRTIR